LRVAGRIASKTLEETSKFIMEKAKGGYQLTEEEIDVFVFDNIVRQDAYPTPIGFMNFPKSVCLSVNECFVHGIPSERTLENGDKLNIDVSIYFDGYHGDNNLTLFFGTPSHLGTILGHFNMWPRRAF
jgi:methionyl aminopeptidase